MPAISAPSIASTMRLRQLRPATISRAIIAVKTAPKARSRTATITAGNAAETATITRPASHSATSPASGQPTIGSRPVQFGTAVIRKPATTAVR